MYNQGNLTDAQLTISKNLSKLSSDGLLSKHSVMLAFLPRDQTMANKYRNKIKNLAANENMASQCERGILDLKNKALEILISINSKAGGQFEHCPDLAEPGTFFISYDVSRQGGQSVGAGVGVFGSNGTVFQHVFSNRQKGEALDKNFLRNSLKDFIDKAKIGSETLKHLVVLRDGHFVWNISKEVDTLEQVAHEYGISVTFVEVTKSGPDMSRFIYIEEHHVHSKSEPESQEQKSFKVEIPHSGVYFSLSANTAILNTIGTGQPTDNWTGRGMPEPVIIKKIKGIASHDQIVKWYYHLSCVKAYSNRTTRLAICHHLADRAAKDRLDGIIYPQVRGLHAA